MKEDGNDLVAVHQCQKCGLTSNSAQTSNEVNVTGVVVCPKCGHAGPLSILIVSGGETSVS